MTGASLALQISDIPHAGPVGCVRVGMLDGALILNPTLQQLQDSDLDLVVAGTADAITMVEAGARQIPEPVMLQALRLAHDEIKRLVDFQLHIRETLGAKPPMDYPKWAIAPEITEAVHEAVAGQITAAARNADKATREAQIDALKQGVASRLAERFPADAGEVGRAFDAELKKAVRNAILTEGIRPDGRGPTRSARSAARSGVLPRAHGSALFTRGQTQALLRGHPRLGRGRAAASTGSGPRQSRRYMHHYNFPPFSVGEVRPLRGPGRREIGHGALAERALRNVLPDDEAFPYTIRIVSEVLESQRLDLDGLRLRLDARA